MYHMRYHLLSNAELTSQMLLYNLTILYIKIELYILKIKHLLETLCFSMLNANSISWKSLKMTYMLWARLIIYIHQDDALYRNYCGNFISISFLLLCLYAKKRRDFYLIKTVNHLSDQQSYDNKCFTKYKHIWTFCEQFQKIFICVIVLWNIYCYSSQWENGSYWKILCNHRDVQLTPCALLSFFSAGSSGMLYIVKRTVVYEYGRYGQPHVLFGTQAHCSISHLLCQVFLLLWHLRQNLIMQSMRILMLCMNLIWSYLYFTILIWSCNNSFSYV